MTVVVLHRFNLGGAQRQALLLARLLKERTGANIHVAVLDPEGPARMLCEEYGLNWSPVPPTDWTRRSRIVVSAARLALALRRLKPDLLLPYTKLPNLGCGLVWRFTGARLCVWNQRDQGGDRYPARLARLAARRTPLFIANSAGGADFLSGDLGVNRERVRVIHNAVALPPPAASRSEWRSQLGIRSDDFVACMIGNLYYGKDHPTLVAAWRRVVDVLAPRGRRCVLALAGALSQRAIELKAQAFDLGFVDEIRFLGRVDDVSGLLRASDLCVFSSKAEGLPNGVLEGMAAGLPVVASDLPGVREAFGPNRCGLLVPPGDIERMARAIIQLATDPLLYEECAEASRQRIASHFGPDRLLDETVEWIQHGLGMGGGE